MKHHNSGFLACLNNNYQVIEMEIRIGTREILKDMEKGIVEKVVLASNAPEKVKSVIRAAAEKHKISVEINGDELHLATSVGKPFPVASVAYHKK
jgi:ribosomal protein L7Ae-like RNA K-turn-binding protein